jgi:hypothetical protein
LCNDFVPVNGKTSGITRELKSIISPRGWVCGVRKQQELVISIFKTVSMFALPLTVLLVVGELSK